MGKDQIYGPKGMDAVKTISLERFLAETFSPEFLREADIEYIKAQVEGLQTENTALVAENEKAQRVIHATMESDLASCQRADDYRTRAEAAEKRLRELIPALDVAEEEAGACDAMDLAAGKLEREIVALTLRAEDTEAQRDALKAKLERVREVAKRTYSGNEQSREFGARADMIEIRAILDGVTP
jgi:hypothetical protein